MRIGVFTENYLPQTNGVAIRVHQCCKAWKRMGHIVDVISITKHEDVSTCGYLPVAKWFGYDPPSVECPSFGLAYLDIKEIKEYIQRKYDFIWVPVACSALLYPCVWYIARRSGAKLMWSYHSDLIQLNDIYTKNVSKLLEPVLKFVIMNLVCSPQLAVMVNTTDAYSSPSYGNLDKLKPSFYPSVESSCRFFILPAGIDNHLFYPMGLDRKPWTLLYVGRVAEEKNLKSLVPLLQKFPKLTLYIVGTGPYMDQFKQMVKGCKVVFLGKLSQKQVGEWYNRVSVSIQPSNFETFGFTILESFACATPCIYRSHTNLIQLYSKYDMNNIKFNTETGDTWSDSDLSTMQQLFKNPYLCTKHLCKFKHLDWQQASQKILDEVFSR